MAKTSRKKKKTKKTPSATRSQIELASTAIAAESIYLDQELPKYIHRFLHQNPWLIRYFIFLQAAVGMFGSLYYSNFGDPYANLLRGMVFPPDSGFPPCLLCWWARILMYPITVISLVGLLKEDRESVDYILPLSVLGTLLTSYHFGLQKFNFPNPFQCTLAHSCAALEVQYFGFVTIPLLASLAFLLITILCLIQKWHNASQRQS